MPSIKLAPSILSADFSQLLKEVTTVVDAGADMIHIDIMDGHFVPNLTIGPPVVKSLRKQFPSLLFDCHLMVDDPERWITDIYQAAGPNTFYVFHVEASNNAGGIIQKIKGSGMKAGLALKPKTRVETIYPFIDKLDMVLIMTVEPGFGGQSFMPECVSKISELRKRYPNLDIEVDGGISPETLDKVLEAGANVIVSGSAIFRNPLQMIPVFKKSFEKYHQ